MAPSDPSGQRKTVVIEPSRGWRVVDLRELWAYRDLLGVLVMRDIKVRYKQTLLGISWVILKPLVGMAIFTAVFGILARIPSDGFPYPIFVFSALVPWNFFTTSVGASGNSLVGSTGLIGKVYFPRLIVPLASLGSGLVDFCISLAFLLVLMPFFGSSWGLRLLAVPLLVIPVLMLALGVGTIFSALTAAYRDFGPMTGYLIQVWFYATPVVYPSNLVPEGWRWILNLNPMVALVEGFRSVFLGRPVQLDAIAWASAAAAAVLVTGVVFFGKVERHFADII